MAAPTSSQRFVTLQVALAALGTAKTARVACPVTGYIVKTMWVSDTAVDATNVIAVALDGTAVTGGGMPLTAATTVAGMVVTSFPTAANRCKAGQAISVATDGGGTVGDGQLLILIEQD